MTGESIMHGRPAHVLASQVPPRKRRGREHPNHALGIGNTALADANVAGNITWMSLLSTWVFTGAAPWFWPLTNLVGPYGMTWPAKVELPSAAMILARSALAARSSASASSRMHE